MTTPLTPVLTAHWGDADSFTLEGYRRAGGYTALGQALRMAPDDLIAAAAALASPPATSGASSRRATASRTTWS